MRSILTGSVIAALVLGLLAAEAPAAKASGASVPLGARPAPALAAELLGLSEPPELRRGEEASAAGWLAVTPEGRAGVIGSTWQIARSVGYSGQPVDILVAVTPAGRIAGARLVRHSEPILTLGISDADIAAYVDGFRGFDLARPALADIADREGLPDVISRATVSTGVIRDAILRTARTLAGAWGLLGGGTIERSAYEPADWADLVARGAIGRARIGMTEAARALAGAEPPIPPGPGAFQEVHVAVLDPPTVGQNLLGAQRHSQVMGALAPGDVALMVASRGLQSHRGVAWRRSGIFDRLAVRQGETLFRPTAEGYLRIDALAAADAPEFREISVFRLPGDRIDATRPFMVETTATRDGPAGPLSLTLATSYQLPAEFVRRPPPGADAPLWVSAWEARRGEIAGVAAMLAVLTAILLFQEPFVRRPKLWRWGRTAFLAVTLVWLGWVLGGQLSVVQVIAFLHSLLTGFRWETFLIEPVIFLLWGFVALGLLFWGRGVYCGWLCPFGALQELLNQAARRFGVPQITVPFVVHERLWAIKYTLFVAILALSFYSMREALILAEVEPFKTAMSMQFMRAWPFVLFVLALLGAGLFIERFYCRYLCPLGAALAIPAKLKLFDWLSRRPQCGRECRLCEQKCTVGAIDPIGRINPNECVLCLHCQTVYHDPATCTVLKRRAGRA